MTTLADAVAAVEAALAGLPESPEFDLGRFPDFWERFQYRQGAVMAAFLGLAKIGARCNPTGSATTLSFAGVRASATSGPERAMKTWLAAARKRIDGAAA